jgi:hypothetical protein
MDIRNCGRRTLLEMVNQEILASIFARCGGRHSWGSNSLAPNPPGVKMQIIASSPFTGLLKKPSNRNNLAFPCFEDDYANRLP